MKYQIFKTKSTIASGVYTYGIKAVDNGKTVAYIEDISTDMLYVKTLTELFEKNNLSPIHLKDVVEDFLVK